MHIESSPFFHWLTQSYGSTRVYAGLNLLRQESTVINKSPDPTACDQTREMPVGGKFGIFWTFIKGLPGFLPDLSEIFLIDEGRAEVKSHVFQHLTWISDFKVGYQTLTWLTYNTHMHQRQITFYIFLLFVFHYCIVLVKVCVK